MIEYEIKIIRKIQFVLINNIWMWSALLNSINISLLCIYNFIIYNPRTKYHALVFIFIIIISIHKHQ